MRRWVGVVAAVLVVPVLLGSCDLLFGNDKKGSSGTTNDPVGDWDSSSWTEHGSITGHASVTVSSSYAGQQLLYVYTNYGTSDQSTSLPSASVVGSAAGTDKMWISVTDDGLEYTPVDSISAQSAPSQPIAQRGTPAITAANHELQGRLATGGVGASQVSEGLVYGDVTPGLTTDTMIAWAEVATDMDGDDIATTVPVPVDVTLAAKAQQDEWAFYIWVVDSVQVGSEAYEDLAWNDASDGDTDVADNIGDLAPIFLNNGDDDDDIFDLVTNVFGDPWGPQPYPNLVSEDERNIHVLLYDIDGDGIPATDGRVVGFFYGVDNYTDDDGNGLVMFHLDAALFDAEKDSSWEITDYWPGQVVSTLAHEFQHMIHFYQRFAAVPDNLDNRYETWMDEANSMVAEDLVSRLIANMGPRGVDPAVYTTGSAGGDDNTEGRIPYYTAYGPQTQLTTWYDGDDVFNHYGISYAFGAFLGRAFGADFFEDLMDNSTATGSTDLEYTTTAIAEAAGVDFDELMRRWGVAYLVSSKTDVPTQYRINNGEWFDSTVGGITYRIGSINAYNYYPYLWGYFPTAGDVPVSAGANAFVIAGTVPAGGYTVTANLPDDTALTVLTHP